MPDLKQALKKAGFTTHAVVRDEKEAEAWEYLNAEARMTQHSKRAAEKEKILEQLNQISSVSKFRVLSRKLLMAHPSLIEDVVRIAHARGIHTTKDKGGRALIAQLLQTRSALSVNGLTDEQMTRVVNETITKH